MCYLHWRFCCLVLLVISAVRTEVTNPHITDESAFTKEDTRDKRQTAWYLTAEDTRTYPKYLYYKRNESAQYELVTRPFRAARSDEPWRPLYSNKVRPNGDIGRPTEVTVDIRLNSIGSVNEINMDFAINIYLRQRWTDPRLAFEDEYNETIILPADDLNLIWIPDLFIKEEKTATFHSLLTPNRGIYISPSGKIIYSQRLSLKLACPMNLKRFPLDLQVCSLNIESYSSSSDQMTLRWTPRVCQPNILRKYLRQIVCLNLASSNQHFYSIVCYLDAVLMTAHVFGSDQLGLEWTPSKSLIEIGNDSSVEMPEFILSGTETRRCGQTTSLGEFPCVRVDFMLSRQYQYYMTQTYIPSLLIVMLSWVSFLIEHTSVPARISLGLLTVLTMTTQNSGINARLPRVAYMKAIDVWLCACLMFVFGALIEFAFVNVLNRSNEKKPAKKDGSIPAEATDATNIISTEIAECRCYHPTNDLVDDTMDETPLPAHIQVNVRCACKKRAGRSTETDPITADVAPETSSFLARWNHHGPGDWDASPRIPINLKIDDRPMIGPNDVSSENNPRHSIEDHVVLSNVIHTRKGWLGGVREWAVKNFSLTNGHLRPETLDYVSRIIFPTCFLVFNLLYWSKYWTPEY